MLIIFFNFFYFLKDREVNLIWRLLSVLKRICCLHCIFIFVNIITSTFNFRVYIFVKNENEAKVGVDLTFAMRIKFLICVRFLYCNCTVLKSTSTVHVLYIFRIVPDPGSRIPDHQTLNLNSKYYHQPATIIKPKYRSLPISAYLLHHITISSRYWDYPVLLFSPRLTSHPTIEEQWTNKFRRKSFWSCKSRDMIDR